jgi:hypothetical protein
MVVQSAGLANSKNRLPSVRVKLRSKLPAQPQKRWSIFCNLSCGVSNAGYVIPDFDAPTVLYNGNEACVKWSYNMTCKAACHIELRENSVQEWIQDKTLHVEHVSRKINPADIFTKEMRDGAHFCHLQDSFMSRLSHFLTNSILAIHHASQHSPNTVTPAAARVCASSKSSGYLYALCSSPFFHSLKNISYLCTSGRHLIYCAHRFVPLDIF